MNAPLSSLELVPFDPVHPSEPAPAAVNPQEVVALEVIDVVAPSAIRHEEVHGAMPSADRFAREAEQQFRDGHIDQPLWDRAVAQSQGDHDAAVSHYLRARATALRLLDRELRHEQRADLAQRRREQVPPSVTSRPPVASGLVDPDEDQDDVAAPPAGWRGKGWLASARTRAALIVAGVLVPVVLMGGYFAFGRSVSPELNATTAGASPPVAGAAAAPVKAASAGSAPAKIIEAKPVATPDFLLKLQQFRDTGNWNMVVLYAVEWTRREPANAAAWNELRSGYSNLRQFDDALAAAKKAVELAPDDAALRRYQGNAHLDLDDPTGAFAAFTEAVARDADDVYSLQQLGLLNARQGRMPESKSAFDLALAVKPGDALTQCLRNATAQMAPIKDAYAAARQVRGIDAKCHGGEVVEEPPPPAAAAQRAPDRGAKRPVPRS
jgi:Flp pilus assembly protein TadD